MEENFIITEVTRVIMVGKDEYPEKKTSFSHRLWQNELIFHFSGYATVYFNGITLKTAPGTVRFLPEGENREYDVFRHEAGECIDIFFRTDRPIAAEAFTVDAAQNEKVGALFKKIFSVWVGRREGYYFEAISLLYRIFAELQKTVRVPKKHAEKIAPALDLIHAEFLQRDIAMSELAAACGMGESYFGRLFRERFGISPKKYIIQLKINHACDLLRLDRYSITQVAELCNFADVYFFSRQFKEYVGVPPTEFAKKYRSSK